MSSDDPDAGPAYLDHDDLGLSSDSIRSADLTVDLSGGLTPLCRERLRRFGGGRQAGAGGSAGSDSGTGALAATAKSYKETGRRTVVILATVTISWLLTVIRSVRFTGGGATPWLWASSTALK